MVIETAPWIHSNYRGCLTLEIANVSNTPLLLYPGLPIGQLILLQVLGATEPEKLTGTYFGPTYPEAPPVKNLKRELAVFGIGDPKVPGTN